MTTDKTCAMTDAAEQAINFKFGVDAPNGTPPPILEAPAEARTLRVDVCPECFSMERHYKNRIMHPDSGANRSCNDKWHDQPAPTYQQLMREAWGGEVTDKPTLDKKLEKPAKVGGGIFHAGVSERLVIEAAQRNYEYNDEDARLTKEERQLRELHRRELWDNIHGSPEPPPAAPVSATPRTDCLEARLDAGLGVVVSTLSHDEILSNQLEESLEHARQLERELAEAKRKLDVQTHAAEALGRLVADKDKDRIFFRDELAKAEARAAELEKQFQGRLLAEKIKVDELQAEIIKEREHSEGLSRVCDYTSNERNELQAKLDAAQKAMEAMRDDMLNKVMAATDDQLEAAIRLEGRDPKDVAALTRQALNNALHTVEMNKLQAKLDKIDCTSREGGATKHCRHDAPCLTCRLAAETKRADGAEAQAKEFRDSWNKGEWPVTFKDETYRKAWNEAVTACELLSVPDSLRKAILALKVQQ